MSAFSDLVPNPAFAGRPDLYSIVHKALRLAMARTLPLIGSADFSDDARTHEVIGTVRELLALSASHLHHENHHVHPVIDLVASQGLASLAKAHDDHIADFAALEALLKRIEGADGSERIALGTGLYRAFSQFMAADLAHMLEEETVTMPLLWQALSDAELLEIEHALVASIPPDEMAAYMRLMIPAMTPGERLGMLCDMRKGAPAAVFDMVVNDIAKSTLPANDWAALADGLAHAG